MALPLIGSPLNARTPLLNVSHAPAPATASPTFALCCAYRASSSSQLPGTATAVLVVFVAFTAVLAITISLVSSRLTRYARFAFVSDRSTRSSGCAPGISLPLSYTSRVASTAMRFCT